MPEAKTNITVQAVIHASIADVWKKWTGPEHIVHWNNASDDWHTPWAKNDLRAGGKFVSRMEARDGSFGFDFEGIYDEVVINSLIIYHIADSRKVTVTFSSENGLTNVTETFETETVHSPELQQQGWQSILNNFRRYCEENP
jgi:uncharacterized protein YndB with AHSA1/START domain